MRVDPDLIAIFEVWAELPSNLKPRVRSWTLVVTQLTSPLVENHGDDDDDSDRFRFRLESGVQQY